MFKRLNKYNILQIYEYLKFKTRKCIKIQFQLSRKEHENFTSYKMKDKFISYD